MKNKLLKIVPSVAILATSCASLPIASSCSCSTDNVYNLLSKMPRVVKVEKMDDLPFVNSRYMVWFKHQIDWNDQSKGYFNQRCEINFRGLDRINQLFTCGYEVRDFKPDRMNDFEIANRYMGNIIKPEYRFFDQSRPEGLSNEKLEGWEYLNNSQAMVDFHMMIESFKTVFSGKWAFSGTSKGGETTECFCMTYPDDCDVYVPYVAPKFYKRGDKTLTNWVYSTIGDDVLGETVANDYKKEIATLQWFALQHRKDTITSDTDTMIERVWESGKAWKTSEDYRYTDYANKHHDYVYFLCLIEFATAFWQYNQNISDVKEFNLMPFTSDEEKQAKLIKCAQLLSDVAGITGYSINGLFFPYESQACREMGEYNYDGSAFIGSLNKILGLPTSTVKAEIDVPDEELEDSKYYWQINLTSEQYQEWFVNNEQDLTLAGLLENWNKQCTRPVFMIFGGSDPWTAAGFHENTEAPGIRRYIGTDPVNACGRTHLTRISTLSSSQQKEIWKLIDEIMLK